MASIVRGPKGQKTIQFSNGEVAGRPKVRLGKASETVAQSIRVKLEALVAAHKSGLSLDAETAGWLAKISDELHLRLATIGLVSHKENTSIPATLGDLLEKYISSRSKLAENTLRNYRTTQRLLEEHFGKSRPPLLINSGHARDYREWLIGRYSPATVSREIKRAKQFFGYAVDCRMLEENPFQRIKAGSQTNSKRKTYVDAAVVNAVIDACPDNEFRLIVSLARYGGLRIPSELTHLTWDRVDWARNRITIYAEKKRHLDGQEERVIPLFPEIRPFLERAFEEAPEGSRHVISEARRCSRANLRTAFLRVLDRAGVPKWPKLFHNLRASRQTELMQKRPAHVVCAWLGNSIQVANDHYLMVTDADYESAAGQTTATTSRPVQNPVQPATVRSRQTPSTEKWKTENPANARYTDVQAPPRGVEPRFSD